jgi:hypothetical protein
VFVVAHIELSDILADKRDVKPHPLSFYFEAVQNIRKVLMRQAALCLVDKEYTYVVGTFCFQRARSRIRQIAHFPT